MVNLAGWTVLFSLIFFLTPSIAVAADQPPDIAILINHQPLQPEYRLAPRQNLTLTLSIAPGVRVKSLTITSSNLFYQEILPNPFTTIQPNHEAGSTITLPALLPSGTSTVTFQVAYAQNFMDKEFEASTAIRTVNGSAALWLVTKLLTTQATSELVNWLTSSAVPRAPASFTFDDITGEDLARLDSSPKEFLTGQNLFASSGALRSQGLIPEADATVAASRSYLPAITELSSTEIQPKLGELLVKAPKVKGELQGSINAPVFITAKTYRVTHHGNNLTKSKVRVSVFSPEDEGISKVTTIVMIPKEAAPHTANITFSEQPLTIEPDPLVMWAFKNIPPGQAKDYTFILDTDASRAEFLAGARAEQPSLLFRAARWILEFFL